MSEIDTARCSCGGAVGVVEPTAAEVGNRSGRFMQVLECDACKTRFVIEFVPPDPEYD